MKKFNTFAFGLKRITMINRDIIKTISSYIQTGKVVLIYGSRRVGKTVLLQQLTADNSAKNSFMNGESMDTELILANRTISNYRQTFSGTDTLVIDEAQNIPEIGKCLKLIVDEVDGIKILASGSSSFDLQNKAGEPLVGRSTIFRLYPISVGELKQKWSNLEIIQHLDDLLVYGSYPEIFSLDSNEKKQRYLTDLAQAYLLKDILSLDGIKNSGKMANLLRLVAYQVGSIVSYDELARQLGLSRNTVEKYLDLLTKVFILYKMPAYTINPRKEISKACKWYFFDNGIRNALIGDYNPLSVRKDTGHLWENFLMSERIKAYNNIGKNCDLYFWRNYSQQEIDLVENVDGKLSAFEFKWASNTAKEPNDFKMNNADVPFTVVNRQNFMDFCSLDI